MQAPLGSNEGDAKPELRRLQRCIAKTLTNDSDVYRCCVSEVVDGVRKQGHAPR